MIEISDSKSSWRTDEPGLAWPTPMPHRWSAPLVMPALVFLLAFPGACSVERDGFSDEQGRRPAPGSGGVVVGGAGGGGGPRSPGGGSTGGAGAGGTAGGMAGTAGTGAVDGGATAVDARASADGTVVSPPATVDGGAVSADRVASPDAVVPVDAALPPPAPADAAPPIADASPSMTEQRCPQTPALALCLTFEGAIADESSHRHAVQVQGATAVAVDLGGARALMTGPGSVVRVAEAAAFDTQTFTLELWIQPRALPAAGQRGGLVDNEGQYGLFVQPGGGISCTAGNTAVTTGPALRAGSWTSIACTLSAEEMVIWVDGRQVGRAAAAGPVSTAGTSGLTVGSNNPTGMNFEGLIDNVRVWRQARTQGQICAGARSCAP